MFKIFGTCHVGNARQLVRLLPVLILFLWSGPASAETLTIALDAVTGPEFWDVQQLDFDAGGQLVGLSEVRLHLVGECGNQMYVYCQNYYPWQSLPASVEISLLGGPEGPDISHLIHDFPDGPRQPVDLVWTLASGTESPLDSLADGTGRIVLEDLAHMFYSDTAGGFVCPVDIPCEIESVEVVLEFEQLVGTVAASWDVIKTIYR